MNKNNAFTLLELLVTLAVISIFAILLAPNLSSFITHQQADTTAWRLATLIQYARSEAIKRNHRVSLCLNSKADAVSSKLELNGQQSVRIVIGNCKNIDATLLRVVHDLIASGSTLDYRGFPNSSGLSFLANGISTGNGTFSYYPKHPSTKPAWRIIINNAGRARTVYTH